jgi:D-xylose transport system ATP-binding protein
VSDAVPVLELRNASKRFGAVVALSNVDLSVHRGEVLALLGDNGAGKSTLIKCLSGVERLDEGTIAMDGRRVSINTPADARRLGIETVYQDLALFDNLQASDNFYAGRELAAPAWMPRPLRALRRRRMIEATRRTLQRLQVTLDHDSVVGLMSGLRESSSVLELILRLRDEGKAVIFASHAMDHVLEVADRAVIMRRARKVGELVPSKATYEQMISMIVADV